MDMSSTCDSETPTDAPTAYDRNDISLALASEERQRLTHGSTAPASALRAEHAGPRRSQRCDAYQSRDVRRDHQRIAGAPPRARASRGTQASNLAIVRDAADIDDVDYVVDAPHISLAEDAVRGRSWTSITAKLDPHIIATSGEAHTEPTRSFVAELHR